MLKQCNPTRVVLLQISKAKNQWQDGASWHQQEQAKHSSIWSKEP